MTMFPAWDALRCLLEVYRSPPHCRGPPFKEDFCDRLRTLKVQGKQNERLTWSAEAKEWAEGLATFPLDFENMQEADCAYEEVVRKTERTRWWCCQRSQTPLQPMVFEERTGNGRPLPARALLLFHDAGHFGMNERRSIIHEHGTDFDHLMVLTRGHVELDVLNLNLCMSGPLRCEVFGSKARLWADFDSGAHAALSHLPQRPRLIPAQRYREVLAWLGLESPQELPTVGPTSFEVLMTGARQGDIVEVSLPETPVSSAGSMFYLVLPAKSSSQCRTDATINRRQTLNKYANLGSAMDERSLQQEQIRQLVAGFTRGQRDTQSILQWRRMGAPLEALRHLDPSLHRQLESLAAGEELTEEACRQGVDMALQSHSTAKSLNHTVAGELTSSEEPEDASQDDELDSDSASEAGPVCQQPSAFAQLKSELCALPTLRLTPQDERRRIFLSLQNVTEIHSDIWEQLLPSNLATCVQLQLNLSPVTQPAEQIAALMDALESLDPSLQPDSLLSLSAEV